MRKRIIALAAPALLGLAFLSAHTAQAALVFGSNLVQNPGAELSVGGATNTNAAPQVVPFWTTTGNFSVVQYTTVPMSVPLITDPGPPDRGANLFAGGIITDPNLPLTLATGEQLQDVSNASALIDTGLVPFALSAYLGGYFDQRDNATFTAIFENAALTALGSYTIGPVVFTDRNSMTGLFLRSTTGLIPIGTRAIDFKLVLNGVDGHQNDAYGDNLSFIATDPRGPATVPEPGSIWLLALGLGGIGIGLRFGQPARIQKSLP